MPCENMLINECNIDYENTLNQIEVLIQSHPHSNVIICGDLTHPLKGIMHRHAV